VKLFHGRFENYGLAELENGSEKYENKWKTIRTLVEILDTKNSENNKNCIEGDNCLEEKNTHFVFIGDSRIRQHFLNIIKVR
jgi:hypothetical protein